MKLELNDKFDISRMYNSLTWSGAVDQAARQVAFGIVSSVKDLNIQNVEINLDDKIKLYDKDDNEIFRGTIFSKDKNANENIIQMVAFDDLIYANNSNATFNFNQQPPESITKEACKEINLEVGETIKGSPIDRVFDSESIYNIIMTAYTFEYRKTDVPYIVLMKEGKLNIEEKGKVVAKYVLDGTTNLYDTSYSESMENAVSVVKMYDEDGEYVGEVKSEEPGKIVDVYKQAKGENAEEMAKELLKEIERSATVRAEGSLDLITGNAVVIKEPYTGLDGLFYIDSDTHTFEGGRHFVELELAFQNLMYEIESGSEFEEEENEFSYDGNLVGSSAEEKIYFFLRANGFSAASAAGIMGNMYAESNMNPGAVESNGEGHGLIQWSYGRKTNFLNYAKSKGKPWQDLQLNLDFLMYEINGAEIGSFGGSSGLTRFKNSTSPEDTAVYFCRNFERAGVERMSIRTGWARKYYEMFKDKTAPTYSGSGKGTSLGDKALKAGESIIGSVYRLCGNEPSTGIDCSGFVQWCYRQIGCRVDGRLTTEPLAANPGAFGFKEIPWSSRKPGDVLYMYGHVALQYYDGKILESGGTSASYQGYSGVAITGSSGRTFNRAFEYVGY